MFSGKKMDLHDLHDQGGQGAAPVALLGGVVRILGSNEKST